MTPAEESKVRQAIAGIDTALDCMDADILRLIEALEAGIPLKTICEINRIIYRAKA